MPKKSLYQTLQLTSVATPEAIKAAYEAKFAPLKDNHTAEAGAQRVILREAFDVLSDPGRRKVYDEKLKRELFEAMSSGGESGPRSRPASVGAETAAPSATGKIVGFALLTLVAVGGTSLWLNHRSAQRIEAARAAEEARQAEVEKREIATRESAARESARTDSQTQAYESRNQENQRRNEVNRINAARQSQQYQELAAQRRAETMQRQTDAQQRRQDQEEARRSQQQLQREQRYLQELERNRGMSIPQR